MVLARKGQVVIQVAPNPLEGLNRQTNLSNIGPKDFEAIGNLGQLRYTNDVLSVNEKNRLAQNSILF